MTEKLEITQYFSPETTTAYQTNGRQKRRVDREISEKSSRRLHWITRVYASVATTRRSAAEVRKPELIFTEKSHVRYPVSVSVSSTG